MKKVIRMCPFMGLDWEDEEGKCHKGGEGLTDAEGERIDEYFGKFYGKPFDKDRAIKLAQMALDNEPVPNGWKPKLTPITYIYVRAAAAGGRDGKAVSDERKDSGREGKGRVHPGML